MRSSYIALLMEQLLALFASQPIWVQSIIGAAALLIASLAVNFILKDVILRIVAPYLDKQSDTIDTSATWFATVAPLLVVSNGIGLVPGLPEWAVELISDVSQSIIVLSIAMGIVKALTYLNEVYERRPQAKNRPIKGYLQVVKILVLCGAAIILISILINESPLLLLSGLGAITAVLLLVFKDTILGHVASVQLSTNDMLRVGDWITMTSMGADGTVVDISLHTVKVQNFDMTIVSIPTHRLVSDSYQNWRGMAESGGRRIKRALNIDQNSVRFLSDDEVLDLKKFKMLKSYLADKREEIADWNAKELGGEDAPVNARRLTNLGTLRAYVDAYLRWHPRISNDFTLMVRQLAPGPQGVSLELYCFTDTTAWEVYEGIQADIFDHLIAIVPEFDLSLFQEPSGSDYAKLLDQR